MSRIARLLFALPLLFVPLAACGADEASAAEVVAGAPAATLEAATARTEMTFDMPSPTGGERVRFTGSGAVDFEAQRAAITMDLGPALAGAALEGIDATVEMIQDGTMLYIRSPLFSQGFGGLDEEQWLSIDVAAVGDMQGFDLEQLQQLGGNDPRQGLAFLTGVSDDVEEVGEEEVRGTATTRYRANVNLEKALSESGAVTDPEQFRRLVALYDLEEVTVDAWIDDDNRVRRMQLPMPMPPQAGGGEITTTVEYFDFGAAFDATAPPADQVIPLQDVLPGG